MRKNHLLIVLVLTLAVALPMPPIARAQLQPIPVFVDGTQVGFDQPPVVIGGRVLVPLRGVFERMGAVVLWNAATNTVIATRGSTQVQLVIGSRQAFVDGNAVGLDVPPLIMGGRTLVPLRFVSEAMGAQVDWDDNARTVYIVTGQGAQMPPRPVAPPPPVAQPAPPPPPVAQPAPPPPAELTTVQGMVLRVDAGASRITVERDGRAYTFQVTRNTAVRLVDVDSGRVTPAELNDVPPGVPVEVTAGPAGRAILVRATVREVAGEIDAVTNRAIVLADGRTVVFANETRIAIDNHAAARRDLRAGMAVTLLLNPQNNAIVDVNARTVAQAPPPRPDALIRSVTTSARAPLRPGEVLSVTMTGASRGVGAFRIEGVTDWLAMRELPDRPGVYVGSYTIRRGDRAQAAEVIARLSLGEVVGRSTAPALVTIIAAGAVPAPIVTAPGPGSGVRAGWVIRGTALPGQQVVVRVDYQMRIVVITATGTLGEFTTVADTSGRWAVTINRDAPSGSDVTISATAVDQPSGQRSETTVITVRQV